MRGPVSNTPGESLASRLFRMSALLIQAGKKDASPGAIRGIIMVLEAAALASFVEFGFFMVLVGGGHPTSWQVSYAYYWMMMPVGIGMALATAIIQYWERHHYRLPDPDSSARWGISSDWWGILKTAAKTAGVGALVGLYIASLAKRVGFEISSLIGVHGLVQNVTMQTVSLPLSAVIGTLTNTWWVALATRNKDVKVQDTLARFLGRSFLQWMLIRPFIFVDADPSWFRVISVLPRVLARVSLVLGGGPLVLSVMVPVLSGVIPHPGQLRLLALLGLLVLLIEYGRKSWRFARGKCGRIVPTRGRSHIHMPMRSLISPKVADEWIKGLTDQQVKIFVWSLMLLGLFLLLLPLALVAAIPDLLGRISWFVVPASIVEAEGAKLLIEFFSSWVQFFARNGRPPKTTEEWAAVYRFALKLQVLTVLDNLLNVGLASSIALGMSTILGNQNALVYQTFVMVIGFFTSQPISALMARYAKTVDAESMNADA